MKYFIDDKIALKHHLSLDELLALILLKKGCNFQVLIERMLKRELIVPNMFGNYYITEYWDDEMQKVLLESDKEIPKENDLNYLVNKLRDIFPKGIKTGSAAWRGNVREITLRLQKFFKIYGNTYSEDQIIEATKKYVDSFNGNYTYMRILKYFILKDEVKIGEDGNRYVEQVSELANFLENEMENSHNNSFDEMRYD
jgi:hypothetical protein